MNRKKVPYLVDKLNIFSYAHTRDVLITQKQKKIAFFSRYKWKGILRVINPPPAGKLTIYGSIAGGCNEKILGKSGISSVQPGCIKIDYETLSN